MSAARDDLAEVLGAHELLWDRRVYPEFECSCGEWDGAQGDDGTDTDGRNDNADAYRAHVADHLARLLDAARGEALREFADKWHAWVIADAPQVRGGAAYRARAEADSIARAAEEGDRG